jgi:hypothetical protein
MRVTFDSNVWRPIVTPHKFPQDAAQPDFQAILASIKSGQIKAFLSETTFTLEAVERKNRKAFFGAYKLKARISEQESDDGSVRLQINLAPDPSLHAKNSFHLTTHWGDAQPLGFKLLRCNRLAGVVNFDVKNEDFAPDDRVEINKRQEEFGRCSRAIEAAGCGIEHLKAIGKKYSQGKPWLDGIAIAPDTEEPEIIKAVAEWADGDAVACHYAYGNDYFCTKDEAKAAGSHSILSSGNRTSLLQQFNIQFVTPARLALLLQSKQS